MQGNKLEYAEIRQQGGASSGKGTVATFQVVALRSGKDLSLNLVRVFPLRQTRYFISGQNDSKSFRQRLSLAAEVVGFPVSALPLIRIPLGGSDNSLDLDTYVNHEDFQDDELEWSAAGFDTSLVLSVSIDSATHVATLNAKSDGVGETTVVFTARDPTGKTGSSAAVVTVTVGPKIVGLENLTIAQDSVLQIDLDTRVEDADNTPAEQTWTVSGGNNIAVQLVSRVLTLTPAAGWTGSETFTFTVVDPDNAQDQKTIAVTVTDQPDTSSSGNGGTNGGNGGGDGDGGGSDGGGEDGGPPAKTVIAGGVALWESTTGDTLMFGDVGDTVHVDIHLNVGSEQANGFELLVAFENQYLSPIDQGPETGLQPYISRGLLPESSVWINRDLNLSDPALTHLHYAEVSLSAAVTDTGTVVGLDFRVLIPIPVDSATFVIMANDTLNQRQTSYTNLSGKTFALIPRNGIRIQNRPPGLPSAKELIFPSVSEDSVFTLGLDSVIVDPEFSSAEMDWSVSADEAGVLVQILKVGGQHLVVTPPANWYGTTTLTFQVTDPVGLSSTRSFPLTFTPVNDPPMLLPLLTAGVEIQEDKVFVSALDSLVADVDDAVETLILTFGAGHTLSAQVDTDKREVRIQPPLNWNGRDTLLVSAFDAAGDSVRAQVPVYVRSVNDFPVFLKALPQLQNVNEDTLIDLSGFVSDADDSVLVWSVSGNRELGASISAGGELTLTVPGGWTGLEVLTITVEDPQGASTLSILNVSGARPGDYDGDGSIGFDDFVLFAQTFGSRLGEPLYDLRFDMDGDGGIGFSDFVLFAALFGT